MTSSRTPLGTLGLSALAGFALVGSARAATLHVPADYATLWEAVAAASDGDEVLVAPGTYSERGTPQPQITSFAHVTSSMTIRSSGGPATTVLQVRGRALGADNLISSSTGDFDVTIDGFTITGRVSGGLNFETAGTVHLRNCRIEDVSIRRTAISRFPLVSATGDLYVTDCVFRNNEAITNAFWGTPRFLSGRTVYLRNCQFEGNVGFRQAMVGIEIHADNCSFVGGASWSIRVPSPTDGVIKLRHCEFRDSGLIISTTDLEMTACRFEGTGAYRSTIYGHGTVTGNTVRSCPEGFTVVFSSGGLVAGNTFEHVSQAQFPLIMARGTGLTNPGDPITIRDNVFSRCRSAVVDLVRVNAWVASVAARVERNTFVGNDVGAGLGSLGIRDYGFGVTLTLRNNLWVQSTGGAAVVM